MLIYQPALLEQVNDFFLDIPIWKKDSVETVDIKENLAMFQKMLC